MRTGAGVHRQLRALVEMVAGGMRRVVPVEAHALVALAHIERRRLAGGLDQPAQLGADDVAEREARAMDRAQPGRRGTQAVAAIAAARQIAETLERSGDAQNGALVEAGRRRELGQRHARLLRTEGAQNGQRPFNRLDFIRLHRVLARGRYVL